MASAGVRVFDFRFGRPSYRGLLYLHYIYFFTFICLIDARIDRPRGVAISKASLYNPAQDFTCFDSSNTIVFNKINDDYCDCKDGSDEPGTSACPSGQFHCTNAGYLPKNIPSSRVCDSICDCCDGSDEYCGLVACSNTCKDLGRKLEEEREAKRQLLLQGFQIKKDYIKQGEQAMQANQKRMAELEQEKSEIEKKKNALEELKNTAESPEKEAKEKHEKLWEEEKSKRKFERDHQRAVVAFGELDSDDDEKLSKEEVTKHNAFDKDSDGTVTEEEVKEHLEDNDLVDFITFHEKVWPNIKDLYKTTHELKEEEVSLDSPPATGDTGEQTTPEGEDGSPPPPDDDVNEPSEDNDDDEELSEFPERPSVSGSQKTPRSRGEEEDPDEALGEDGPQDLEDDKVQEEDTDKKATEDEDRMPDYEEDTKQLITAADEARKNFDEAASRFTSIENELNDVNKALTLDMGASREFYPLKDQCYEYTDREYTYKMCVFNKVTQRRKEGGGDDTDLGTWGKWFGPDDNKYIAMKYENGAGCWNGPARSALIHMSCGTENHLMNAYEPNKCEYEFDFRTPALCNEAPVTEHSDHDEL